MSDLTIVPPGAAASNVDQCWNRIGVRGDRSCPELPRHVHCSHCPVYSVAALTLLEREPPVAYLAERTDHFAKPQLVDERDTQSVVVFRIETEWLALPTTAVQEVADLRRIHSVPHRRSGALLGVANVRGELVACASLAQLLGLERSADPVVSAVGRVHQRLLVLRSSGFRAVAPADEVHGVHRFSPRELTDVPTTVSKASAKYSKAVLSWRERTVGLLDDQLVFQSLRRSLS